MPAKREVVNVERSRNRQGYWINANRLNLSHAGAEMGRVIKRAKKVRSKK